MICQIVITEGWAGVLLVVLMALIAWAWKIQGQVSDLRSDMKVLSAKEEAINGNITEMKADISEIKKHIMEILGFVEGEKVLRENGKTLRR